MTISTSELYYKCMTRKEMTNERSQSDVRINSAERGGIGRSQIESLFKTHYTQMYHLALTLLFDEAESKDVVSDVFASLLSGSTIVRADNAKAFLLTSVYNRCLNVLQHKPFAAIHVVRNISTPKPQQPTTEQTTDIDPVTSLPADTVQTDTISVEPCIFNNVPLDSMLTAIATAHGVGVEFENEAARQLRFHFVWKREDSLSRVVEKLNTFETVNIVEEDKKLVVR